MPWTVNGIGTNYFGEKNKQVRNGACRSCGSTGLLSSYDTRLWFVIFFIPVIPLGRKRITDFCGRCKKHYVAGHDHWEKSKQLSITAAMEQYRQQHTPESALMVHGQMLAYGMHNEATHFRQAALAQHADSAVLRAGLAMHLDQVGLQADAAAMFEEAFKQQPDLPEARVGVALRRMFAGQLDEARTLLLFLEKPGAGQLYSLSPLDQLAALYQNAGRHVETLDLCRHLLAEIPEAGNQHKFREFVRKSERAIGHTDGLLPARSFSLRELFSSKSPTYSPRQRWCAIGAVISFIVCIGLGAFNEYQRTHRTVHLFGGASQPVEVAIDGGPPVHLAGRATLTLSEGTHHVAVSGAFEDQYDFDLRTGYFERFTKSPLWLINADGTAAIYHNTIHYAVVPQPNTTQLFLGQPWFYVEHVDYPFQPPPPQMQVGNANTVITKIHLAQATESALPLLHYAAANLNPTAALKFAEGRMRQTPNDSELLLTYMQVAQSKAMAAQAETFLKTGLWKRPISIPWHRTYLHVIENVARGRAILPEYDAELQKEPNNGALLYLRGRVTPDQDEALRFFRRAAAADPQLGWPHLAFAAIAASNADWKSGKEHLDRAAACQLRDPILEQYGHWIRLGLGEDAVLETEYRQQLSVRPPMESARTLIYLCDLLCARDRFDEAKQTLDVWLNKFPPEARNSDGGRAIQNYVTYLRGDFSVWLPADVVMFQRLPPDVRVSVLVALRRPEDVANDTTLAEFWKDPWNELMLSVALRLAGREADGQVWLERACAGLEQKDLDSQRVSALLNSETLPTTKQIETIQQVPPYKALMLAALAQRFPEHKSELLAQARQLNLSRLAPYQLLQQVTDEN